MSTRLLMLMIKRGASQSRMSLSMPYLTWFLACPSEPRLCGKPFAWCNRRLEPYNIREPLNRSFANSDWRLPFPKARVIHLNSQCSYRLPIILDTKGETVRWLKPFCLATKWTLNESSKKVVGEAWDKWVKGFVSFRVVWKLKLIKEALKQCNKCTLGTLTITSIM